MPEPFPPAAAKRTRTTEPIILPALSALSAVLPARCIRALADRSIAMSGARWCARKSPSAESSGALITLVFTAANVYLGLRASLPQHTGRGDLGMGVLAVARQPLSVVENNIVQTIASAAGTLSSIIFVLPGTAPSDRLVERVSVLTTAAVCAHFGRDPWRHVLNCCAHSSPDQTCRSPRRRCRSRGSQDR